MSTNDSIDEILSKAADFDKIINAPEKVLSPKLLAELDDMFSKPATSLESEPVEHILTTTETTSLLLMIISRQSVSTLDLVEALKKQNVVFEGGHGIIFGFLQKLEKQGYLTAVKKLRRDRELKIYTITDVGRRLVQQTVSKEQALNSLAVQISAVIAVA